MPPLKYFVPNSFTAISLLLGLASVAMSVDGQFELAAWMILWGTLLDKLDGTAARLCKATSEFGVQFDSFADFVTFGIAPAALIYYRSMATGWYEGSVAPLPMAAAGIYVLALAVRLARFNIEAGGKVFHGVPGTVMGAVIGGAYLTWAKYQLDLSWLRAGSAVLLVGAGLMVSSLRLHKLAVRKNRAFNIFQFSNVIAAYILAPLMLFPEYLFALAASYTVFGLLWCLVYPPDEASDQAPDEPHEQLAT